MVEINKPDPNAIIDATTRAAFADLIGKECCRQRVGRGRSLSVGFGERVPHSKAKAVDPFYGQWEIGTYSAAWRIVHGSQVLCGSMNVVDSIDELDGQLQRVKLGAFEEIVVQSKFDIRIELNSGIHIDFICASTDDDEIFHIFGPNSAYVEYKIAKGWKMGKSHVPWT